MTPEEPAAATEGGGPSSMRTNDMNDDTFSGLVSVKLRQRARNERPHNVEDVRCWCSHCGSVCKWICLFPTLELCLQTIQTPRMSEDMRVLLGGPGGGQEGKKYSDPSLKYQYNDIKQ